MEVLYALFANPRDQTIPQTTHTFGIKEVAIWGQIRHDFLDDLDRNARKMTLCFLYTNLTPFVRHDVWRLELGTV